MYNLKPIFKSAFSALVKTLILLGAAYFIYSRLIKNNDIDGLIFYDNLKKIVVKSIPTFVLILSLSLANWLLEILKWQSLVSTVHNITFITAAKQCLSALTASLFTPNRLGDYVAKSLYFKGSKTKIIALNSVGHGLQLSATIFFGLLGLAFLSSNYPIKVSFNTPLILLFLMLMLSVPAFKSGRFWARKLFRFYKNIKTKLLFKISFLSVLRYLIFSHQYYILLLLLGLQVGYITGMAAIFSMYLLASLLPALSIADWLVKGSVAVFVFGFLKVPALLIVQVSLLMWVLNFALPAIVGSVYIVKFKINQPKPVASSV